VSRKNKINRIKDMQQSQRPHKLVQKTQWPWAAARRNTGRFRKKREGYSILGGTKERSNID
jgi:hypothetical protein